MPQVSGLRVFPITSCPTKTTQGRSILCFREKEQTKRVRCEAKLVLSAQQSRARLGQTSNPAIWDHGCAGDGVAADADMPAVIYVETLPGAKTAVPSGGAASVPGVTPEELSPEDLRARAAGFADEADRVAVRKMRFGR